MSDLPNNTEVLDVTPEAEVLTDSTPAKCPDKDIKGEKKLKRKIKAAKALGIIATIITTVKVVLCPVLSATILVFDFLAFCYMMLGGALILAMVTIVLPFLPLILIVLGLALAIVALIFELSPIILGIIGAILASSTKKHVQAFPEYQKSASSAKKTSIFGLIFSIVFEPVAVIPALLLSIPFVILLAISALFIVQLFGLAIA